MAITYRSRIERGPMAGDHFTQISNALFRDARISLKAKGLFGLISTHSDGYGLTVGRIKKWCKEGKDAIRAALEELESHGYLEREQQHDDGGKFAGVVYRITDMPAHLYELFGENAPQLPTKARKSSSPPMSGFPATDNPAPENPTPKKNNNHKNTRVEEDQEGQAPTARSAGDARRATAGSGAREAASGSAATSKTPRPKKQPKLTREQVTAIAAVEATLPLPLVELLPYRQLPTSVRHLVAHELGNRTVDQLTARVARRWEAHGYAQQVLSAEGPSVRRAVGMANRLVGPSECPDPSCEDGRMIDTGADCPACPERKADRRARGGKAPVPGQREATPSWECANCGRPGKGEAPADLECRRCKQEAEAACRAAAARWEAQLGNDPAQTPEPPQEPAEAPRRPDTAETATAETDDQRADREELDRLRAEIAAANPGLAAIAEKANH
ncbi:helix-turn-helix domain-containing protein [Streptomyces sp. NPDC089424]|uniref:helix-turn-helix domain-containing protein n=1 Tax=Streptomyces sp. NPDC089424 TaxID=3365917 RepID=UPI003825CF93